MKKCFKKLFIFISLIFFVVFVLNINVTTRKGVNYKIHTIKIPLYLKILDFYERHYNYKFLTRSIVIDEKDDKERVLRLLEWTYKNIKDLPEGFPIIDDHVWHTIVRGYGVSEQFTDIFTTLCNYADLNAFMHRLNHKDKKSRITISFVKINKKWVPFDPYNGVYFKKQQGGLSDVQDIVKGDWTVQKVGQIRSEIPYNKYFQHIPSIDYKQAHKWSRANIQKPINRAIYQIRKYIN